MKAIKFRAWDSISKELHNWDKIKDIPLADFELDHYDLLQFTGLLDKNGVEIYEGDKVGLRLLGIETHIELCDGVVEWCVDAACLAVKVTTESANYTHIAFNHNGLMSIEVIGNIYEQNK